MGRKDGEEGLDGIGMDARTHTCANQHQHTRVLHACMHACTSAHARTHALSQDKFDLMEKAGQSDRLGQVSTGAGRSGHLPWSEAPSPGLGPPRVLWLTQIISVHFFHGGQNWKMEEAFKTY